MRILKSVVIVDDEPDLCITLKRMFELSRDFDFQVMTTVSADLGFLLNVEPDVLITDLDLGSHRDPAEFGGFQLLSSRGHPPDSQLRIVYSGYSDSQISAKAIELGATAFFGKSECSAFELVNHVEVLLQRGDKGIGARK